MEEMPASILIIGSGLFGLSTAWALTRRPQLTGANITVVDHANGQFPPPDSASVDSSRLVRADYADPDYTALATAAQAEWRRQGPDDLGGQGRYSESGLVLTADEPSRAQAPCWDYVKKSCGNVVNYAASHGHPADAIRAFESKKALKDYLGTHGHVGDWGYLNSLSGWADAGKSMRWLRKRVDATRRVNFVDAEVKYLETEGERVLGARLSDGSTLRADVVVVAAGAWSGELVDLRGIVEATGHPGWRGLFLATGDSGHGFKFLPVLGDKVVDCLLGQGGQLGQKWRWKEVEDEREGRETGGKFRGLVTRDESRGGDPGTILQEELGRDGADP